MHIHSLLALIALALAYTFDFVNGFHDTANAVATVIYTKALRAPVAIIMSGFCNFLGCLVTGTAVAHVITEVIPHHDISLSIIMAVLAGGLAWNLYTWYHGIPVSSSHCLIGGLFGAGIAAHGTDGVDWTRLSAVVIALLVSPFLGFVLGLLVTLITDKLVKQFTTSGSGEQPVFMRRLQVASSAALSFTHGSNDGQKTMGVIAMILASQFPLGGFTYDHVPFWVITSVAATIGLGTTIGGWRVIRTVGTKISRESLRYTHGFSAEIATAAIILTASVTGSPISTTHTLSSAVAGGTIPLHGVQKLNMQTVRLIFSAWVLTVPVAAALAALCLKILQLLGLN